MNMNTSKWVEAIESIHKLQLLVDNAQAKMNERKEEISGKLFELAKTCKDVNEFDQRCAYAEGEFKKAHKKGTKIPKHWTQIKSNIKAAMRFEIDLADHETESSMRKELNEKRKAAKAEQEQDAHEQENARPFTPLEAELVKARLLLTQLDEDEALDAVKNFNRVLELAAKAPEYKASESKDVQPAAIAAN